VANRKNTGADKVTGVEVKLAVSFLSVLGESTDDKLWHFYCQKGCVFYVCGLKIFTGLSLGKFELKMGIKKSPNCY
jgi:hypothetical protein